MPSSARKQKIGYVFFQKRAIELQMTVLDFDLNLSHDCAYISGKQRDQVGVGSIPIRLYSLYYVAPLGQLRRLLGVTWTFSMDLDDR